MADIFLSYSQKDRSVVEQLARRLTERGFSVWYDIEMLSGSPFRETIMRELEAARAVIVVWSLNSVGSRYVQDETEAALSARKLIATRLPDLDPNAIPFGFRSLHTDITTDEHRIYAALRGLGVEPYQSVPPRSASTAVGGESFAGGDAIAKLQEIEHWKEIRDSSDPRKIRTFILQFPKGSFYHHAFEMLANLEWKRLPQNPANSQRSWLSFSSTQVGMAPTQDEKALEGYILEFDGTHEANEAKSALSELVVEREKNEWSRVKTTREPDELSKFISSFPRGRFEAEARQIQEVLVSEHQAEDAEWRRIAIEPDLARVRTFIKRFPDGRYKAAAADREEELGWDEICKSNDLLVLKRFIERYPKGRFAGDASKRFMTLGGERALKDAQSRQPPPWYTRAGRGIRSFLFWVTFFFVPYYICRGIWSGFVRLEAAIRGTRST